MCEALGIWDIIPKTGESIRVVLEKEEEHEEYTEDQGDRQNQNQKEKNQIFQIRWYGFLFLILRLYMTEKQNENWSK